MKVSGVDPVARAVGALAHDPAEAGGFARAGHATLRGVRLEHTQGQG